MSMCSMSASLCSRCIPFEVVAKLDVYIAYKAFQVFFNDAAGGVKRSVGKAPVINAIPPERIKKVTDKPEWKKAHEVRAIRAGMLSL